jgi:hypothetical protein
MIYEFGFMIFGIWNLFIWNFIPSNLYASKPLRNQFQM